MDENTRQELLNELKDYIDFYSSLEHKEIKDNKAYRVVKLTYDELRKEQ